MAFYATAVRDFGAFGVVIWMICSSTNCTRTASVENADQHELFDVLTNSKEAPTDVDCRTPYTIEKGYSFTGSNRVALRAHQGLIRYIGVRPFWPTEDTPYSDVKDREPLIEVFFEGYTAQAQRRRFPLSSLPQTVTIDDGDLTIQTIDDNGDCVYSFRPTP